MRRCGDPIRTCELVTVFRFLQVLFVVGQAAVLAAVERRQHLSSSQIVERDAGPVTIAKDAGEDWTCFWGWGAQVRLLLSIVNLQQKATLGVTKNQGAC